MLCFFTGRAQELPAQPKRYTITLQPLQLFCREISLQAERNWKRHALGVLTAYRFSSTLTQNPIGIVEYLLGNFPHTSPRYQGILLGFSAKYYFSRKRDSLSFIECQFFYRRWWTRDRKYYRSNPNGSGSATVVSSEDAEVWGAKLLVGKRLKKFNAKHYQVVCDIYGGVGIRRSWGREQGIISINTSGSPEPYKPYSDGHLWKAIPSAQLGFRLGCTFISH